MSSLPIKNSLTLPNTSSQNGNSDKIQPDREGDTSQPTTRDSLLYQPFDEATQPVAVEATGLPLDNYRAGVARASSALTGAEDNFAASITCRSLRVGLNSLYPLPPGFEPMRVEPAPGAGLD